MPPAETLEAVNEQMAVMISLTMVSLSPMTHPAAGCACRCLDRLHDASGRDMSISDNYVVADPWGAPGGGDVCGGGGGAYQRGLDDGFYSEPDHLRTRPPSPLATNSNI